MKIENSKSPNVQLAKKGTSVMDESEPLMSPDMAMHHLQKAEEIRGNPKMMSMLKEYHKKMGKTIKAQPVKSIDDIKKARDEAIKDSDKDGV